MRSILPFLFARSPPLAPDRPNLNPPPPEPGTHYKSRKSEAVVFTSPPDSTLPTTHTATDPPLAPLAISPTQQIQWAPQTKYLGMRFAAQAPTWDGAPLTHTFTAADRAERKRRFHALRQTFTITGGGRRGFPLRLPSMRVVTLGIRQVIHAKDLYPTTVMDVTVEKRRGGGIEPAYTRLDSETHRFLCSTLGVPFNTPKALLWTECHLWPTRLYRDLRTINYARNLQAGWLWRGPIRALQCAVGSYDLLRQGALLRLAETLADNGHDLDGLRERNKTEMRHWTKGLFEERAQQLYDQTLAGHTLDGIDAALDDGRLPHPARRRQGLGRFHDPVGRQGDLQREARGDRRRSF